MLLYFTENFVSGMSYAGISLWSKYVRLALDVTEWRSWSEPLKFVRLIMVSVILALILNE